MHIPHSTSLTKNLLSFTHIVILAETEELADLGGTLGTQSARLALIGQTRDIRLTLLDNGESENGQVIGDNAATDRLSLALTSSAWAVAAVAVGEEESDTSWVHDTLLHRETLLVVATGDLESVALELIANAVARDLCSHAALLEDTQSALIVDFDNLVRAERGIGNVELHLDRWCSLAGTVSREEYLLLVCGVRDCRWQAGVHFPELGV